MFGIPLDHLMFAGIGFCLAWLTALIALPAVHNRAMRLARQRYDDVPLSMREIRAEKDTIRAGFATATRDLEIRLEQLREKTVAHATDAAKKNQLIDRLKQELQATTQALRESETREQSARDGLREAKRGFADKDVTLGTAEDRIATLQRELASKSAALKAAAREIEAAHGEVSSKDTALRTAQRDIAAMRSELAGKDTALNRAEREVAAIKAEISALTTLLVQVGNDPGLQTERPVVSSRRVEVVPFVAASRPVAKEQPDPARSQPAQEQAELQPVRQPNEPPAPRARIDVVAAASHLIPPAIPRAQQQSDDGAAQALTEIVDAARRVDERHTGINQRLRAIYAPAAKGTP